MPRSTDFDPNEHINKALSAIDAQISQLQVKRDQLAAVMGGGKKAKAAGSATAGKTKRPMSDEARQKISAAQQRRWAEAKEAGATNTKKKK